MNEFSRGLFLKNLKEILENETKIDNLLNRNNRLDERNKKLLSENKTLILLLNKYRISLSQEDLTLLNNILTNKIYD